jgi:ABC-type transporter Mla subunit MlaD
MKKTTSSFLIGIFVIIGIGICIFALGWLGGGKRYFRSYSVYAAFFSESVRGLYPTSNVAFQGVDIGHVQDISVAPDHEHVMVTLRIYRPDLITKDVVAEIGTMGIAGAAYVEIFSVPAGQRETPPALSFPVAYPVIPTRPSALNAVISSAKSLAAQLQASDLPDLFKSTDAAVKAAENILSDAELKTAISKTASSLAAADVLISSLKAQIDAADLPGTVAVTRRTIEDLGAQTRGLTGQAAAAMVGLQQASDSLNRLLQRLYIDPSALLSSRYPPQRPGGR